MEKRDLGRKRLRLAVDAAPGGIRAYTSDISPTGLFLNTKTTLKPGSKLRLQITMKNGETALAVGIVRWTKRVPAALMRHVRGGMGIEFTWVSPELQQLLDEINPEKTS